MQESFGASLDDLMFEEIDHALVSRIESMLQDSILEHEPRIVLRDVDVSRDPREPGVLQVRLDYTVPSTNSRFNMVFPFYIDEASSGRA